MNTKRLALSALLGLFLIAGLIAADIYIFRTVLSLDYARWYIGNGAWLSLGFAFITLAWSDLNQLKGLVSAHPLLYAAACLYLVVLPFQAVTAILRRPAKPIPPRPVTRSSLATWSAAWRGAQSLMDVFDGLVTIVFGVAATLGVFVWLVFVAPAQYVVFLICAAPARLMRRSKRRVIATFDEAQYFQLGEVAGDEPAPKGWFVAGFFARPVSMTASFAAMLLWVLAQLVR